MNRIKLRENTFKLLFSSAFHDSEEMKKQYEHHFEDTEEESAISEEDKSYITNRVNDIVAHQDYIDEQINEVAVKWTTNRMSTVDLTILRLAYYEMKMDDEIPEKVAVDQAVELAKKYGSDNSASFVNGILAKLF